MFTKLLAYEIRSRFRADARSFGAFIAVIAVAAGIVAAGLPGISGFTTLFTYILCALTPVACVIAAMADYWKTLYGQRGYFTMSLPVSGRVIFWAKNTRIMIECLLALALAVGGIIAVASAAAWSDGISLAEYTADLRSQLAIFSPSVQVILIMSQLIAYAAMIVQVCAVMTLAAEGRFNHMGFGAVAIGLVLLYIVNQILSGVGTFFLPFSITPDGHFSTESMWSSYRAALETDAEPTVWGLGACIVIPLFALLLAAWASRSIEKHTSLR